VAALFLMFFFWLLVVFNESIGIGKRPKNVTVDGNGSHLGLE